MTDYDQIGELLGLPARMTDHTGKVKAVDRDALGRVVRESMPGGISVAYAYDSAGRLSSVLDPEGNELAFGWSASGALSYGLKSCDYTL